MRGEPPGSLLFIAYLAEALRTGVTSLSDIDDEAYQIIGVAPRELEAFDARMKFVVPLSWPAAAENPQGRYGTAG
jgi:hypothetical protein